MNYKNLLIFTVALFLTFTSYLEAHEKKWPEKRLRQSWPAAQSFTSKQMSLTSSQISLLKTEGVKIGTADQSPTFFFAQEKSPSSDTSKTLGIILFVDEYGANGLMEVSVAMGEDGQTKKIDIWEHSENPMISKDDFLKQFVGKSAKDSFVINKDYRPLSDATTASVAVARAVEKALKITNIVFGKTK
jgi:hypothetical protein